MMHLKQIKSFHLLILFATLSCTHSHSQPSRESLPGTEVLPGNKLIDVSFFVPFEVEGTVIEIVTGKDKVFRYFKKEMSYDTYEGNKVIKQILTYSQKPNKKVSGIHTTYFDPNTFQVLFWEYKSQNKKPGIHFAFRSEGTKLYRNKAPSSTPENWQFVGLDLGLFQNETRELFFRSLHKAPKGTQVKFPVVGMRAPYHGWVSYEYTKDDIIQVGEKEYDVKIWSAIGNPDAYYAVTNEAPYVIRRQVPTGKKSTHIFIY